MRVQTEEWHRFIPGVRMYKGKLTYFYNGEKLWDADNQQYLIYNEEERQKWKVIMVLPGVEIIPRNTFDDCKNIETVVMSDSVKRIEGYAFQYCESLEFVRLSKNLEYIGNCAFWGCKSLTSMFIPESCTEIGPFAFQWCEKLIIFNVPRNTQLGVHVIYGTALSKASPMRTDGRGCYDNRVSDNVNEWIKNLNQAQEFALHRECASIESSEDNIYEIIKQHGLPSIHVKNQIGVTPLEYLEKNPYTENQIDQHKLMKKLVLDLVGEITA